MTEKEIIELARKTRQAQKDYFASRRYNDLHRSKELERQLDKAIEEYTASNQQLLIDIFNDNEDSLPSL